MNKYNGIILLLHEGNQWWLSCDVSHENVTWLGVNLPKHMKFDTTAIDDKEFWSVPSLGGIGPLEKENLHQAFGKVLREASYSINGLTILKHPQPKIFNITRYKVVGETEDDLTHHKFALVLADTKSLLPEHDLISNNTRYRLFSNDDIKLLISRLKEKDYRAPTFNAMLKLTDITKLEGDWYKIN